MSDLDIRSAHGNRWSDQIIQNLMKKAYSRRFSVGSCHSNDEKTIRRISIEQRCDPGLHFFEKMIDQRIFNQRIEFIVAEKLFDELFHSKRKRAKAIGKESIRKLTPFTTIFLKKPKKFCI